MDDVLEKKISKVKYLIQDKGNGYMEAIEKVKYDIDGDELYDMKTGQTVCHDISTATDEQIRNLLQIKKDPLQRVKKKFITILFYTRIRNKSNGR